MIAKTKLKIGLLAIAGLITPLITTALPRQAEASSPRATEGQTAIHSAEYYFPKSNQSITLGETTAEADHKQPMRRNAAEGAVIYGLVKQGDNFSFVETTIQPTATLTEKAAARSGFGYDGGAFYGGKFYAVGNLMNRDIRFPVHAYDVNTWQITEYGGTTKKQYILSLTANQADEIVYGSFTNSSSSYEFGTFDIPTATKTVIAALPQRFPAIAADNAGAVYGIAVDGNLYSIDPASALTTLIGATGQTVGEDLQSAFIDPEKDIMYWATGNKIYTVSTSTGEATLAATIENADISQWAGLFTISAKAGTTPTWVGKLSLDFDRDNLTGNILFTLPEKDTAGGTLTSTLEYHVLVDGNEVLNGNGQPGEAISRQITVAEGTHKFSVYTVNNGTKGNETSNTLFVGHDTPKAPTNPSVARSEEGKVTISWDAVNTGVNNAYLDIDAITYRVVRQPDNKVVAEATPDTSVTDTTIDHLDYYTYEITAGDGSHTSDACKTSPVLLGQEIGVALPFEYLFDSEGGFGLFTQNDANTDGYAWKYDEGQKIVWYEMNPSKDSDDWLISPVIHLEAGKNYNLKFHLTGTARMTRQEIEVYYGSSPDPKDLKKVICENTPFIVRASINKWFAPDVSGPTYIGLRVVSPAVEDAIMINDFSLSCGYADGSPAEATEATATAAPKGGKSATVKFTLPTKDFAGKTLESITSATVTNTTTGKVYDVATPVPGKAVEITDENPADGNNTYKITSFNADGEGLPVEVSTWVGLDIPGLPQNIKWTQTGPKSVHVSWDAPAGGEHDGYVDMSDISYYIAVPSTQQTIATHHTTTSLDLDIEIPENQAVLSFVVAARNAAGLGTAKLSNGNAYGTGIKCPFYESFENAGLHSTPWMVKQVTGYNSCNILTDVYGAPLSYDDEGMAVFTTLGVGSTRLETPLLDLTPLKRPALKMWVYFVTKEARLVVRGTKDSGVTWTDLKEVPNDGGKLGWHLVSVPLDPFAGQNRMQVGLEMYVAEQPSAWSYILVDKMSVTDYHDTDLMMTSMTVPQKVNAGETFVSSVSITNAGSKTVESYRINASVNGTVVATKECPALAPDSIAKIDVDVPLSPNATRMELIMAVECDGDGDNTNDAWISKGVQVVRSRYPQPLELSNKSTDNSVIELDWTAPESRYEATITDDMESYPHGSVGGIDVTLNQASGEIEAKKTEGKIGPYKLIDKDEMLTSTAFGVMGLLPHDRDGMVCQVIDLAEIPGLTDFSTIWSAHSSSTLLCFWQSRTANDNYDLPNDDWFILPRLSAEDPRISFWAKSLTSKYGEDSFEIMVSMDGDDISDFESYETVVNVPAGYSASANAGYTFYEFELPEGTQYAAIHYNASGTVALLIDDLSYTPAENYEDLTLIGYNVYRNGVKINDKPIEEPKFTDRPAENGDYLYNVTTVFAEGESRYSNTVRVLNYVSGVESIASDNDLRISVSGKNILVRGAKGETISLYAPDGALLDERQANADTELFTVGAGIYVVRTGNVARAVIVK